MSNNTITRSCVFMVLFLGLMSLNSCKSGGGANPDSGDDDLSAEEGGSSVYLMGSVEHLDNDADGTIDRMESYTYDANKNVTKVTYDTNLDGSAEEVAEYTYDAYNSYTKFMQTVGDAAPKIYTYENTYDANHLLANVKISLEGSLFAEADYQHGVNAQNGYNYEYLVTKEGQEYFEDYFLSYHQDDQYSVEGNIATCYVEVDTLYCEAKTRNTNGDCEAETYYASIPLMGDDEDAIAIMNDNEVGSDPLHLEELLEVTADLSTLADNSQVTTVSYQYVYDLKNHFVVKTTDMGGDGVIDSLRYRTMTYSDGTTTTFTDADADGFPKGIDCDDGALSVGLPVTEVCGDGKDNDCDGTVDEGECGEAITVVDDDDDDDAGEEGADVEDEDPCAMQIYYQDSDDDSWGNTSVSKTDCSPPADYVTFHGDCDDENKDAYPGATEICDGKDNDCDDEVDEGLMTSYYPDNDGDGYGDKNATGSEIISACSPPANYVADRTDCCDTNATCHSGVVCAMRCSP